MEHRSSRPKRLVTAGREPKRTIRVSEGTRYTDTQAPHQTVMTRAASRHPYQPRLCGRSPAVAGLGQSFRDGNSCSTRPIGSKWRVANGVEL